MQARVSKTFAMDTFQRAKRRAVTGDQTGTPPAPFPPTRTHARQKVLGGDLRKWQSSLGGKSRLLGLTEVGTRGRWGVGGGRN